MKFSAQIALACFSAGALANVAPRALDDFDTVLTNVQYKVDELDLAVKAFNGDISPLQAAATKLVDEMSSGNNHLSSQPALSLADTFAMNSEVNSLKHYVKDLTNDCKTKRPVFMASGNCGPVRENLVAIKIATDNLIETIKSKVHPLAKSIAEEEKRDIQAMLEGCQDYYNTKNCP
ncbi:hypothetical protein MY11210_008881 [Beauveria gryllotalpidicola]